MIHQSVDASIFYKILKASTTKEACVILERCFIGGDKIRKVRLQLLRKQYELLQMEERHRVVDYLSRVLNLVNQMRGCNEQITDVMIMKKIMCTVNQSFDHIVVAIEESKEV